MTFKDSTPPASDRPTTPGRDHIKWLGVCAIFMFPAFGGFLFGYDIGSTSYVIDQLEDADNSGVQWHQKVKDSSLLQGLITSSGVGGAFIAAVIVFRVADVLGRRREMLIAGCLYIIGAVLEALSCNSSWDATQGLAVLITGRWIYGLGCGFAMHGIPAYIGEMAPSAVRGKLISMKEACIVLGILAGYAFGFLFKDTSGGWKWTYGVAVPFAVVFLVGVFFLPPSARWLCLRGRPDEEVLRSLLLTYKEEGAELALQEIKHNVARETSAQGEKKSGLSRVFERKYRASLMAGCGLVFLQQITGQPSVLYYANTILKHAGLTDYAAILIGAFKFVATMFAVTLVENKGRRFLLFLGIGIMTVALGLLTFLFIGTDYSDSSSGSSGSSDSHIGWREVLILVCMFSYIGGYQIGFGPIAWLMVAEVFPLEVRGSAIALAVQQNFFWNFVVTLIFPEELSAIGAPATFAVFAGLCVVSLVHVRMFVPETKGLELEQVQESLRELHKGGCGTAEEENESLLYADVEKIQDAN
eukprot:Hpha_TRINITY_DN15328_c4_g2::TRINITY_DN15328_c4_g2_i1::g.88163::m.88163